MKKVVAVAVLTGLAVATGCASSGNDGLPGELPARIAPAPSVYALIGDRERLELTGSQVSALDSIGRWLSAANDSLSAGGSGTSGEEYGDQSRSGGSRRMPASMQGGGRTPAAREALSANNASAMAGVEALLSEAQKQKVCSQAALDRSRAEDRQPERARAPTRSGSSPRPSMQRGAWSWCGTAAAPAPANANLDSVPSES